MVKREIKTSNGNSRCGVTLKLIPAGQQFIIVGNVKLSKAGVAELTRLGEALDDPHRVLVETLEDGAEIWIEAVNEDITPAREARSLGDREHGKRFVKAVQENVKKSGLWGWCTIRVVYLKDGIEGEAFVGACSYESAWDFKHDEAYYPGKVAEAKHEWARELLDAKPVRMF